MNLLSLDENAKKVPSFTNELYDILKELSQNRVQLNGQITGIVKKCIFCKKDIRNNKDQKLFQHICGKVYHISCIQQMESSEKVFKNINCINKIDKLPCLNDECKQDILQLVKSEFSQNFICYCSSCQNYTQIQPKKDQKCNICCEDTKYEDFMATNYDYSEKCDHTTCYKCVIDYLDSKKSDINQIRKIRDSKDDDQEQLEIEIFCFGGCGEIMDLNLVLSWGMDGSQEQKNINKQINEIFEKLQQQLWSNVLFKCPDCKYQISVSNKINNVRCVECHKVFCTKCLQPQHQNNCNEIDKIQVVINSQPPIDDFDAIFYKIIKSEDIDKRDIEESLEQCQKWRYCCRNGCGTFFTKDKGCNHIKCQSCQTDQCFVCSAPRQQILCHGNHYHRLDCPDSQNDKKASIQQRQQTKRKVECTNGCCQKNDENMCIREGHYCLSCRETDGDQCCEPPQQEFAQILEQNIKNIGLEEKAIIDKFQPIQLEAFKFKLGISNKINNKELSLYFYKRNWQLMQSYIKDKNDNKITNFLTEDKYKSLLQKFEFL